MINNKFEKLFYQKARKSETEKLTQFHMDIKNSSPKLLKK